MTAADRLRCADAAELAADPLVASVPAADHWLLVEHPGPWGARAIADSRLDPVAASALARWTETNRSRVTLIRRPGRAVLPARPRRWCRIDCRAGRESIRWGSFVDERALINVLADPTVGEPATEPIYLVCVHGRHDTCCAVRGRPVAAALAGAFPQRTWECTHVAGDRFAANLVLLPHGFYYGRVQPHLAVDLVNRYNAGRLHPPLLRGRSSVSPAGQAAQHYARLALGEEGIDAFPVLATEQPESGRWQVRLRGHDGTAITVALRVRMIDAGRPLTCAATRAGRYRVFDLVDLR